jgi:hypothetical protein
MMRQLFQYPVRIQTSIQAEYENKVKKIVHDLNQIKKVKQKAAE